MNKLKLPEISIIIATYKRLDCLARLLDSLINQTTGRDLFEIIVVDNAPEEVINKVKILCGKPAYASLDLHYIHHPVIGLSAARNRGVAASRAELIGFLDDDSLPHQDWVELAINIFSETKPDILGGPIEPYYLFDKPDWFRDSYAVISRGNTGHWLTGNQTVVGGNMAWRKVVLEKLGGFSTAFGYVGKKKVYGEETELNLRARHVGYTTWYDPSLRVNHYADPKRMRVGWFFSSGYRYGQIKARLNYEEWHALDSRPIPKQILSHIKSLIINLFILIGSLVVLPLISSKISILAELYR